MSLTDQQRARMQDLLADRAVFGLNAAEQDELRRLQAEAADSCSDFDQVAADILLADLHIVEEPPSTLVARLIADADVGRTSAPTAPLRPVNRRRSEVMAWFVSACLLVVTVFALNGRPEQSTSEPGLAELRERFLSQQTDAIQVPWLPSKDPAAQEATGDVVWSPEQQAGVMRFRGLKPNDPTVEQYQLWIIDGERNAAQPVDGGVFDVPPGSDEVLVKIAAKLTVFDPRAFAVTIERPGGVVVSDRERLALLASVDAG